MTIAQILANILSAVYGRDVRQSIHDGIEKCYSDVTTGKTMAETAADNANDKAALANTAATNANTKAGLANTAATNANDKATLADAAATAASTQTGLAENATLAANTAATNANDKATLANNAATLANTKAGLADTAATNANDKAGLADSAASNANDKAALANNATTNANTATTNANNAATNANDKATLANNAATLANTKAGLADTAATNANNAASEANDAADYANSITQPYVHIRYSENEPQDDSDMTTVPSDWIGIYSGTSDVAPTSFGSYTWYKIKGETGSVGTHVHGNITNDGKIGTVAGKHLVTGTNGLIEAVNKPAYTASEVGAAEEVHNHDSAYLGKMAQAEDSKKLDGKSAGDASGNIPVSNGTLSSNLNADLLDGVHLTDIRLGQQLLINWDFRNPVNQRKCPINNYLPGNAYGLDGWATTPSAYQYIDGGLYVPLAGDHHLVQRIAGTGFGGKTYTTSIAVGYGSGVWFTSVTMTLPTGSQVTSYVPGLNGVRVLLIDYTTCLEFRLITELGNFPFSALKLELGTVSTLHLDPPMDYGAGLLKCQRYYYAPTAHFVGTATGTTWVPCGIIFPVEMRVAPTVSITGFYRWDSMETNLAGSMIADNVTKSGVLAIADTTGLLIGGAQYYIKLTASAEL